MSSERKRKRSLALPPRQHSPRSIFPRDNCISQTSSRPHISSNQSTIEIATEDGLVDSPVSSPLKSGKELTRLRKVSTPSQGSKTPPSTQNKSQEPRELTSSEWECSTCTYLNPQSSLTCHMCRTTRDPTSSLSTSEIACPQCTFCNKSSAIKCEMCQGILVPVQRKVTRSQIQQIRGTPQKWTSSPPQSSSPAKLNSSEAITHHGDNTSSVLPDNYPDSTEVIALAGEDKGENVAGVCERNDIVYDTEYDSTQSDGDGGDGCDDAASELSFADEEEEEVVSLADPYTKRASLSHLPPHLQRTIEDIDDDDDIHRDKYDTVHVEHSRDLQHQNQQRRNTERESAKESKWNDYDTFQESDPYEYESEGRENGRVDRAAPSRGHSGEHYSDDDLFEYDYDFHHQDMRDQYEKFGNSSRAAEKSRSHESPYRQSRKVPVSASTASGYHVIDIADDDDEEEDDIFQFEDGQDELSTEPIPSIPELAEHFVTVRDLIRCPGACAIDFKAFTLLDHNQAPVSTRYDNRKKARDKKSAKTTSTRQTAAKKAAFTRKFGGRRKRK